MKDRSGLFFGFLVVHMFSVSWRFLDDLFEKLTVLGYTWAWNCDECTVWSGTLGKPDRTGSHVTRAALLLVVV